MPNRPATTNNARRSLPIGHQMGPTAFSTLALGVDDPQTFPFCQF